MTSLHGTFGIAYEDEGGVISGTASKDGSEIIGRLGVGKENVDYGRSGSGWCRWWCRARWRGRHISISSEGIKMNGGSILRIPLVTCEENLLSIAVKTID